MNLTLEEILKNENNQSDFFLYFDEHDDEFELDIDNYDENQYGWGTYYHKNTNKYIYVYQDVNNACVFEIEEVAKLICNKKIDVDSELFYETANTLQDLIGSTMSGFSQRELKNNKLIYKWFNVKESD